MPTPRNKRGSSKLASRNVQPTKSRVKQKSEDSDGEETARTLTTGRGWDKVHKRKLQADQKSGKNRPVYLDIKNRFFLQDGETAEIQLIEDEPFGFDGVQLPPDFRDMYVSRTSIGERYCPLIEAGLKSTWRGAFRVLDYRGEYDSKTKKHNPDTNAPEKYWVISLTVATMLETLAQKRGKGLSEMVLEITRSGEGKNTTYSIEVARDKNDKMVAPIEIDWELELPECEEAFYPLSEKNLNILLGNVEAEDDDAPRTARQKSARPINRRGGGRARINTDDDIPF